MKKLYSLLLVFIALLTPESLWADNWHIIEVDGIRYEEGQTLVRQNSEGVWIAVGYTVSVGGQSGEGPAISTETTGTVTIPEEVTAPDGLPCTVDFIGSRAFQGCKKISTVILPNTIEGIASNAFADCESLVSVNIPKHVTSIGDAAFSNCKSLKTIELPNGLTTIGSSAFGWCTSLETFTVPSTVTKIVTLNGSPVNGCSALKSIQVESGNTVFDSRNNCNAIINTSTNELIAGCMNTVIPDNITAIGTQAFNGCTGLTSISIPSTVTSIGWGAFTNCSGLTEISIPNSVKSIGMAAFRYCDALKSVVLPNMLESIERSLFYECYNLASINIPNSVTTIGDGAFYGCKSIESLTIGKNVSNIGNYAFGGLENLKTITVESENSTYDSRDNCNAIINSATNELIVGFKNTVIPNTVTSIGYEAFYNCI